MATGDSLKSIGTDRSVFNTSLGIMRPEQNIMFDPFINERNHYEDTQISMKYVLIYAYAQHAMIYHVPLSTFYNMTVIIDQGPLFSALSAVDKTSTH